MHSFVDSQSWVVRGKVVTEDGSPPPKTPMVELICEHREPLNEGLTDRAGRFFMMRSAILSDEDDPTTGTFGGSSGLFRGRCSLRATLAGYESTYVQLDRHAADLSNLTPIVLSLPHLESTFTIAEGKSLSKSSRKLWTRVVKASEARSWPEADVPLRELLKDEPGFAPGWQLRGLLYQQRSQFLQARQAYEKSIELDPRAIGPRVLLTRLLLAMKEWKAGLDASEELMRLDTQRLFPEALVHRAVACYQLNDLAGAEKSARQSIALDGKHLLPRANYILGHVLAARHDYPGAIEQLNLFLAREPKASDHEEIRKWVVRLGTPRAAEPPPPIENVDWSMPAAAAVNVPGGIKALSAAAGIKTPVTPENFFAEYSKAVVRGTTTGSPDNKATYGQMLVAYFHAAAELYAATEDTGRKSTVTLSLAGEKPRARTAKILPLLGWKLVVKGKTTTVEPGDQAADGNRQPLAALFGIDEVSMQEALEAGKSYSFELPTETARLAGGDAWLKLIRIDSSLAGGLAETILRDTRLARVYLGLNAMGTESAMSLVSAVGLRSLIVHHSALLGAHPAMFTLTGGRLKVPGGAPAEAVWTEMTGTSPQETGEFLTALLAKDDGRLAAYYAALWEADEIHQRFFTASASRATRFYHVFQRPGQVLGPKLKKLQGTWPEETYRELPMEGANVRFPGGREAWHGGAGTDEDVLLSLESPDHLLALAKLEEARKARLDAGSAHLLARHAEDWKALWPYFERLPALGAADFQALESFTGTAGSGNMVDRNQRLGEWHSLVELIALGARAGSLTAADAAKYFRHACQALEQPDYSVGALETLRAMTGRPSNLDDAVPGVLLRLDAAGRARFESVLVRQNVPRLDAKLNHTDPARVLNALAGLVYAAHLDPDSLLVSEDSRLVTKHQFTQQNRWPLPSPLFPPASLRVFTTPAGGYFLGGFAGFAEVGSKLPHGGPFVATPSSDIAPGQSRRADTRAARGSTSMGEVFRADSRLVEVHVTVTDEHKHYVDDLNRNRFQVMEEGKPQSMVAFEASNTALTCALLLDTSGSMQAALPALKNAVLKLLGELREGDSIAVYAFNHEISQMQAFTTDKRAAKRVVLKTLPDGMTALYDSLARVSRDLSTRAGKKVIVLFSDGADNSSSLTVDAAVRRAKVVGAPVYSIAQGDALRFEPLLKLLRNVSTATGGLAFSIKDPSEIGQVFEAVANDMKHGYLLTYRPDMTRGKEWRRLEVRVSGGDKYKLRARDGYYPE